MDGSTSRSRMRASAPDRAFSIQSVSATCSAPSKAFRRALGDRVIATNFTSVFHTIQVVVPHMKATGGLHHCDVVDSPATKVEQFVGTPYVVSRPGSPSWCAKSRSSSPATTFR